MTGTLHGTSGGEEPWRRVCACVLIPTAMVHPRLFARYRSEKYVVQPVDRRWGFGSLSHSPPFDHGGGRSSLLPFAPPGVGYGRAFTQRFPPSQQETTSSPSVALSLPICVWWVLGVVVFMEKNIPARSPATSAAFKSTLPCPILHVVSVKSSGGESVIVSVDRLCTRKSTSGQRLVDPFFDLSCYYYCRYYY